MATKKRENKKKSDNCRNNNNYYLCVDTFYTIREQQKKQRAGEIRLFCLRRKSLKRKGTIIRQRNKKGIQSNFE